MAYIPPLDPLTAKDNPRLKSLHTTLASTILNEDGSVKISNDDARREASMRTVPTFLSLGDRTTADYRYDSVGTRGRSTCCSKGSNPQIRRDTGL